MLWEHLVRSAQDRDVAVEAVLREEVQKACLAHLSLHGFFKTEREMPRFLPKSILQLYESSGWAHVTDAVLGLVPAEELDVNDFLNPRNGGGR